MKIIIACRHGEAYKNLKDICGGLGSSLTPNGVKQVENLAKKIEFIKKDSNLPINIYASCQREHVRDTAFLISCVLGVEEVKSDELFKPIRLGVFDGLSKQEREQKFAVSSKLNSLWEQGLVDIRELEKIVPTMQTAEEYFSIMSKFVKKLPEDSINILVGTRSDMSCLKNVLVGNDPKVKMSYKYYPFDYTQTIFAYENSKKEFNLSECNFNKKVYNKEKH